METLINLLLAHSWKAGTVVLAILAIRRLWGTRLSPSVRHVLWFFVAAAVLLPVGITIPVYEKSTIPPIVESTVLPIVESGVWEQPRVSTFREPTAFPAADLPLSLSRISFSSLVAGIWLGGFVFLFCLSIRQIVSFQYRIRESRPITEESVRQLLRDCSQKINLRTPVGLFECDRIGSPLLIGIFHPRILLPKNWCQTLSSKQLSHLFLHELAHVKRRDILTGGAMSLLCMLHWFNPLLWLAIRLFGEDSESAADRLAITRLREPEKIEYGFTLLELASLLSPLPLEKTPNGIGVFESPSKLSRRIEMIQRNSPTWNVGTLFAVALCAVVCLATLTRFQRIVAEEIPTANTATETTTLLSKKRYENSTVKKPIQIRGRIVSPDGVLPRSSRICIRALSPDNEQNLWAGHDMVREDGTFVLERKAHTNYELEFYDETNRWTAKPVFLEVGAESPTEEVVFQLEKGALIEGTVLDQNTGRPIPNFGLIFAHPFEVLSKRTGKVRVFPNTHYTKTDAEGKFRRCVLPGRYGVATERNSDVLFRASLSEKARVSDPADWQKPEVRTAAVFDVGSDTIVSPVLRINP